jgi:hypothetical protein
MVAKMSHVIGVAASWFVKHLQTDRHFVAHVVNVNPGLFKAVLTR